MKHRKKKTDQGFYVSAWSEGGVLFVVICAGGLISGTTFFDTGLPDGDLPWLTRRIIARIEQGPCRNQEQALCIADQVIQESRSVLLALACPCNEIPISKRQHKGIEALC